MGGNEGENGQDWDISRKNTLRKTAKLGNCEDLPIEEELFSSNQKSEIVLHYVIPKHNALK